MKNKILSFILFGVLAAFSGCIKEGDNNVCTNKLPSSEAAAMQTYASANGISVTTHSSGIMYQVLDPGTGPTPGPSSRIFVRYEARYVSNNTIFDQATNSANTGWTLNSLIPGWQIGIPLINEGGHIKLIVPSSLAYGCQGYNVIPGDAILFFDIYLDDVQ